MRGAERCFSRLLQCPQRKFTAREIQQEAQRKSMKYLYIFLVAIFSAHAIGVIADPFSSPASSRQHLVIPLNQNLAALDYSKEGKQTGCGLRITGEAEGDLWVNILLSVFIREADAPIGMFKVVVKKINMQNGKPVLQDGKISYSSIGKIHQAWIKTDAGVQLQPYANGVSAHGDGYMTSLEFSNAMDLLSTIPQARFKVGFSKSENEPGTTLEFDKRITQSEADKLSACMRNLRGTMEEKKGAESF